RNWANAHNFYGDFADLDAAHLGDVQAFFKTYYVPNNAVLLLLGDVRPGEGMALAEKHFSSIPAGPQRARAKRGAARKRPGTIWHPSCHRCRLLDAQTPHA